MPASNRATRRAAPKKATTAKKAAPRKETPPPKSTTSLAKRVEQLEADLALQAWCFEELKYALRLLMAQSMMSNPAVQQQLSMEMARRMGAGPLFNRPPGSPIP